jgi:hypothetical protein
MHFLEKSAQKTLFRKKRGKKRSSFRKKRGKKKDDLHFLGKMPKNAEINI